MKTIFSIWQRQDGVSFEALVAPHIERLYRLAYRFSGSQHDAEDLVQELLVKLYPRGKELAGIEKLGPWLAKSLYHLFIDQARRATNSPVVLSEEYGVEMEAVACVNAEPDMHMLQQQHTAKLEKALLTLNVDQRSLIAMHDMEGYTLPELSTLLETPLGTLKSRLHRARAALRDQLTDK